MRRHRRPVALLCVAVLAITGWVVVGPDASAATPPTIAVGDVTVPEGNAGTTPARVSVRLSNPVATNTIVRFTTTGGTASPGADYRKRTATVRIRAGKTSGVLSVSVLGDSAAESTETVGIRLTGASGLRISDATGTVTIRDDEGVAGVSIGDAVVWEGDARSGLAKITVVMGAAATTDVIVRYASANGTAKAPGDYRTRAGTARIRAGRRTANISVTSFGDAARETDETFRILLTSTATSGIPISDGVGTVTIRNDEPGPASTTTSTSTTTTTTTTLPALPGAPTDLNVVAGPTARYLTADWSAPTSSLPITGYDLEVTRGATTNVVASVSAPYPFGCGLAVVTDTCTVRVRARNANGDGPWSTAVTASTWSPPEAPPNLTLSAGGSAVFWDVPASDRPIDHYLVQKQPLGGSSWTHVTTTTNTHASTTCTSCAVRVSAQSEIGLGPWSTVEIEVPGAPTGLTATRDSINPELVHIAWSPPADPGSHPVTSYDVFVNEFPTMSTHNTTVDVFLRSTLTWQITVYANNLAGRSFFRATVTLLPA